MVINTYNFICRKRAIAEMYRNWKLSPILKEYSNRINMGRNEYSMYHGYYRQSKKQKHDDSAQFKSNRLDDSKKKYSRENAQMGKSRNHRQKRGTETDTEVRNIVRFSFRRFSKDFYVRFTIDSYSSNYISDIISVISSWLIVNELN